MSGIKGKNTKPELALRHELHARNFRYRLHSKHVPGRPDLVLGKHHAVVLVHGCFWHHHAGCRFATTPATRTGFWQSKFEANCARDRAVKAMLLLEGWRVATIWECALRKPALVQATTDLFAKWVLSDLREIEISERDIARTPDDAISGTCA